MTETTLDQNTADNPEQALENLSEIMRDRGQQVIAQQLEQYTPEEFIEPENFQQLKNLSSSGTYDTMLESIKERIAKELGKKRTGFNLEKHKDKPKTDIAREMADYAVNVMNIRPIYKGNEEEDLDLYKYNPKNGLWEYISNPRMKQIGKQMARGMYTVHMQREFLNHVISHENFMQFNDLGTPAEELVINNAKKLMLNDLSDLKDLETKEVDREDYALHKLNADYNPEADCPKFKDFVETLLNGREDQIKTLQEFMGWMLKFPDREFKKALIILGVSNSGKSQLAELVEYLFGQNNGRSVTNVTMPQIGFRRTFHVDKLEGSIVNIDKDLSGKKIDDPSIVKTVTAQERLNVEPKGEDSYTINTKAKHFICANTCPRIENEADDAFYGRFLTLKAPYAVPREDRVKDLGKKLFEEEADGILNWMLEGLRRLDRQGDFTLHPEINETRRMWWEFGESTHRFIWMNADVNANPDDYISKDDLYEHYLNWCKDEPSVDQPESRRKFKEKISKIPEVRKGRKKIDGMMQRCFLGIGLNKDKIYSAEDSMVDQRPENKIDTD